MPARRSGRLRSGTLWATFVVALLAGAASGWLYRSCSTRTIEERAHEAVDRVRSRAEEVTK